MSRAVLDEHRRLWDLKPELATVYAPWFEALLAQVPAGSRVVEAGAGPGHLADHARRTRPDLAWVATELIDTPWNDVVADAQALPFQDGSADAVMALDLLHHIAGPRAFLDEAARVLRPGGVVAVVEPWVSPFSYPLYRFFHQEGCRLDLDPWNPFERGHDKEAFEGDAAVLWRLIRLGTRDDWHGCGLEPPEVRLFCGLAWVLTLGFRERSLLPRRLAGRLVAVDRALGPVAPWIGMRALATWRRIGSGPAG